MRLAILMRLALLLVACSLAAPSLLAADDAASDAFRAARKEILPRLRHRQPEERIAGLRQLHDYPTAEAVKLLVQGGLTDREPQVRRAAYETLLEFKDHQEVCDLLLATLAKESRKTGLGERALPILSVLLASELEGVDREVLALLDRQAATARDGALLVATLADELGAHGEAADVALLVKLTKTEVFARQFGPRRAVVQALVSIPRTEAIAALVELLPNLQGEVRADVVERLTEVSGEQNGLEAPAWAAWWEKNRDTFQFPAALAPAGGRNFAGRGGSSYYGLSLYAQRLVFILDTSGSMSGPRLAAAKRELIQAIDGLPDDTYFGVVVFNSTVGAWQKQLAPATSAAKRAAERFVDAQGAQDTTASYDALEAAFRFDAEAIYFLTDGAPHGGKVTAPDAIVDVITRLNRARRLSIYTIGIGVGAAGGEFDTFLAALAKENFGAYRRVDQ